MRPVALVLALALLWAPAHPLVAQGAARIVAIGDIHGEIEGFKNILKAAGLTDANGRWSGGRTQLIQTGDYTDRGTGTRAVMDLLMALEPQARSAGGRAFALLGNHEVMNLIGDTRDVTREIFATFATADSEKRRLAAFEDYTKLAAAKTAKGEPVPAVYSQTREAWLTTHPPGYVEYREAFAPRGKYGAWLRDKPIVTERRRQHLHARRHLAGDGAREDRRAQRPRPRRDPPARSLPRSPRRLKARHPHVRPDGDSAGGLERNLRGQRDDCGREGRRPGTRSRQAERAAADGSAGDPEDRFVGGGQSRRRALVSRPGHRTTTIRKADRLPRCWRSTARSGSSPATRRSRMPASTPGSAGAPS